MMINSLWETTDFGKTIKDFEFTRRAMNRIGSVVYSAEFEDKDAGTIFMYLLEGMELVSFKDYLKRYLYERAEMDIPFKEVDEKEYRHMVVDSFRDNAAPYSFEPTSKKISVVVGRWLNQDSVRRPVIFLLGFGLRMSPEDVSEFLTKVLKEEDFNEKDPAEVIYRYCFANDLRFAQAQRLLKAYEEIDVSPADSTQTAGEPGKHGGLLGKIGMLRRDKGQTGHSSENQESRFGFSEEVLRSEESLMRYLRALKAEGRQEEKNEAAYNEYMALLSRTKEIIARIWQEDEDEEKTGKTIRPEDISSGDIEKVICSGIPVNGSGNLQKMSASLLSSHFEQRRFSRQRIDSLEKKKFPVERFDLITLLFFIYSQDYEEQEPEIRCKAFIEEMNQILKRCGMLELYPVNPYEAFILMCLLAECPLATYSDIWEMSFGQGEGFDDV